MMDSGELRRAEISKDEQKVIDIIRRISKPAAKLYFSCPFHIPAKSTAHCFERAFLLRVILACFAFDLLHNTMLYAP